MAFLLTFNQPLANSDPQRKRIFQQAPHSGALTLAGPGRLLNKGLLFVAHALRSATNRALYRLLGLGPRTVARKIRSLLQATGQQGTPHSLDPVQQKELAKYCSKLLKYALPSETPTTQRLACRHIVQLVTLFPGLRVQLRNSEHLRCMPGHDPSMDSISAAWGRPAGESQSVDEKWIFWCTVAATCLTESRFSAILEASQCGQSGGLDVIEQLVNEQYCDSNLFTTALCIRYLDGIMNFHTFWFKLADDAEDPNIIGKKLCLWTVHLLKDLGVDATDLSQAVTYFDYAGIDGLAHRICLGLSTWLQQLDQSSRPHQFCYESLVQLVQFLRLPRCARLLPDSYTHAFSDGLRALVPVVSKDGQVDILVEVRSQSSDGGSHRTLSILESDVDIGGDIGGSDLEVPNNDEDTNAGQPFPQELDDRDHEGGSQGESCTPGGHVSPPYTRQSLGSGRHETILECEADIEDTKITELRDDENSTDVNDSQPVRDLDDDQGLEGRDCSTSERENSDDRSLKTISSLEYTEGSDFRDPEGHDHQAAPGNDPVFSAKSAPEMLNDSEATAEDSDPESVSLYPVDWALTGSVSGFRPEPTQAQRKPGLSGRAEPVTSLLEIGMANQDDSRGSWTVVDAADATFGLQLDQIGSYPDLKRVHETARGKRNLIPKALLIGVRGTINASLDFVELKAPHQDVERIKMLLIERYYYRACDISILIDDGVPGHVQPTRNNVLKGINDLIKDAKSGDRFAFYYSGHSTQIKSCLSDGRLDGCLVPCDSNGSENVITNTELNAVLVMPLPAGSQLVAILDTSHSGSLLDLEYAKGLSLTVAESRNWIPRNQGILSDWDWMKLSPPNPATRPPARRRKISMKLTCDPLPSSSRGSDQDRSSSGPFPTYTYRAPTITPTADTKESTVPAVQECDEETPTIGEFWVFPEIHRCASPDISKKPDAAVAEMEEIPGGVKADVISLSSCREDQFAYEDDEGNTMTSAFVLGMMNKPDQSLNEVLLFLSLAMQAQEDALHARVEMYKKECHRRQPHMQAANKKFHARTMTLVALNPDSLGDRFTLERSPTFPHRNYKSFKQKLALLKKLNMKQQLLDMTFGRANPERFDIRRVPQDPEFSSASPLNMARLLPL